MCPLLPTSERNHFPLPTLGCLPLLIFKILFIALTRLSRFLNGGFLSCFHVQEYLPITFVFENHLG